jgi:hypothetical protein
MEVYCCLQSKFAGFVIFVNVLLAFGLQWFSSMAVRFPLFISLQTWELPTQVQDIYEEITQGKPHGEIGGGK